MELTCQITEELEFCTVAVNTTVPATVMLLTDADTLTVGGGGSVIVKAAAPAMVVSDWSSAATVTKAGLGTAAGAT
jgi:hypothetical protein